MTEQQRSLVGRTALVTGGSRGLGRAMVLAFAAHGADVVIASRDLDACAALATEVRTRHGRRALAFGADVGDWEQCDQLVDAAYAEFGAVDLLVNNAGMSPLYPSLDGVSEKLWDKVMAVNLKGPFRLSASIGSRMAASGDGGSIINISSVIATRPTPAALPYAAAKAGLNALTEGFAHAFGPKVRVNGILCGQFRTDIAAAWGDAALVDEAARRTHPVGRIGEPDDIVGAALYFASPASSYCTGALLRLDGGARRDATARR